MVAARVAVAMAVLACAATAAPAGRGQPFMCRDVRPDVPGTTAALQVGSATGCQQGGEEGSCDPLLTVPGRGDVDVGATALELKQVNWTTPRAYEGATCDDCSSTLVEINNFCHAHSGGRLPLDPAAAFVARLAAAGMSDAQKQAAMGVYKAVVSTYCPNDPCTQAFGDSVKPDTICRGALIDCARHSEEPVTPPEQVTYRGHGVNFRFNPPNPIPPLACTDYIKRLQGMCTSSDASAQYKACDDLVGFKRDGCDYVVRALLSSSAKARLKRNQVADFCPLLFQPTGPVPDPRLPTMPAPPPTPVALDPRKVCSALALPDYSPVPTDLWKEAIKPTPTVVPLTATPVPTPTSTKPCVQAPTPTPMPLGIHQLFKGPVGGSTVMFDKPLIPFGCSATTSWTTVRPKVGCHFPDYNQKLAGFGDAGAAHRCTCRSRDTADQLVSWSDVANAEDCAQMTCNRKHRFTECAFDEQVVAHNGQWNGDTLKFNSIVLQETCSGGGTLDDVCGAVVDIKASMPVATILKWKMMAGGGAVVASAGGSASLDGEPSALAVTKVWLPCGTYAVDLIDPSYVGGGWTDKTLSITDSMGVQLLGLSPPAGTAQKSTATFALSQELIDESRKTLCVTCGKKGFKAKPCASFDASGTEVCVDYLLGSTLCPPRTLKCSTD